MRAVFITALLPLSLSAAENPDVFFRQKVRPILEEHCFKCHSHSANKIKGGLVLDSRAGLLEGGDTGPALVPGQPEKSLLVEAIGYANHDLQMPPKGEKLSAAQIAVLTDWVKAGAVWPEEAGQKMVTRAKGKITDEDRKWWAFQPVAEVTPPQLDGDAWSANELDRFVLQKLRAAGLEPAPLAAERTVQRRLSFALTGLPPGEAVTADELLASPRYGERQASWWLDLARYAESDGYKSDDYRPTAWRYRDYVVAAFNADKPYDRFVREQLAGDELFPDDPAARTATGFLRNWIYEYNNRDAPGQWTTILNDITDTAGDVFLGLGVQCARCHDHKFDPILQRDYYRLQAFFAPLLPDDHTDVATADQRAAHAAQMREWEEKTAAIRAEITALEQPHRDKAEAEAVSKFPPETQALMKKPDAERTPLERQHHALAFRQVTYEWDRLDNKIKGADKGRLVALGKQRDAVPGKPAPLPTTLTATDIGPVAPPVFIPKKQAQGEIEPGFPTLLDPAAAAVAAREKSTGRRAALAEWLTRADNPLTARVIVNRVWAQHFGRGLVENPSDFGKLTAPPSHPELLDWLSRWFVREGWSLKKLHRLIVSSATFRQSADNPLAEKARLIDPENKLLWHFPIRRLDAEQTRDALLAATGELDLTPGGPGSDFSKTRRAVFTKTMRNTHDAVLEAFDGAERFQSQAGRNVTTTATQALLLANSPWILARARAFADSVEKATLSGPKDAASLAIERAFSRPATDAERSAARAFLTTQEQRIAAAFKPQTVPFASEKMRLRDGRAALMKPGSPQDRLIVSEAPELPDGRFTIEAFVTLNSTYDGGEIRTIAAQGSGKNGAPGWSFGVTGKASRYKPATLVLTLSGDRPWNAKEQMEPVFSGLSLELGRPYFVAVSVDLADTSETGVIFYLKDLNNDDEPLLSAGMKHNVTTGVLAGGPLTFGARHNAGHYFDGLLDDVRLTAAVVPPDRVLWAKEGLLPETVGYWKFEPDAPLADSSSRAPSIEAPTTAPRENAKSAALADFCQALLNANEFLYVD